MPRKPRMFSCGVACHVVQRGHNRSDCFFKAAHYQFYLSCLVDACQKYQVDLHAYVLMTNHVHLLMTPADKFGISLVMQSVGRKYVQYINRNMSRTGTLFEGRFNASLVQSDRYLLTCMRYIELNPVRAKMVARAEDYPWSSFHVNAGLVKRQFLVAPASYLALGERGAKAEISYSSLFNEELEQKTVGDITNANNFNMPYGSKTFMLQVERQMGRKIGFAKRGRPQKHSELEDCKHE